MACTQIPQTGKSYYITTNVHLKDYTNVTRTHKFVYKAIEFEHYGTYEQALIALKAYLDKYKFNTKEGKLIGIDDFKHI